MIHILYYKCVYLLKGDKHLTLKYIKLILNFSYSKFPLYNNAC